MAFVPKRTKEKEPAGYKSLYIKEKLIKEIEKIAKIVGMEVNVIREWITEK